MPEENNQVFDVSKPGQSAPSATSRPVIVGYQPNADPMVARVSANSPAPEAPESTSIPVRIGNSSEPLVPSPSVLSADPTPDPQASITDAIPPMSSEQAPVAPPSGPMSTPTNSVANEFVQAKINNHPLFSGKPDEAPPKKSKLKKIAVWFFVVLLVVALAGYLLIDSGLARGASHLPFHIFKQKVASVEAPTITPQATITTNPYAGWKTYSDSYVSFKYPSTWTVDNTDETIGKFLTVNGPNDTNIDLLKVGTNTVSTTVTANSVQLSMFFTPSTQQSNCMGEGSAANTCTIYDATSISIDGATSPKLVISDFDQSKHPDYITLTDDPAAVLDAKTFKNGLTINQKAIVMSSTVRYKDSSLSGSADSFIDNGILSSAQRFKTSQSYKDLTLIIESASIK